MTRSSPPPRRSSGFGLRPIEESDLVGFGPAFDDPSGWGDQKGVSIGGALAFVGWLVLAVGLAFGSAGIVAATEHLPTAGGRPELTWGSDKVLSTRLDAAIKDLASLKGDVDALGTMARQTLSAVAQVDRPSLQAAWDGGWKSLNSIDAGAADLTTRLRCGEWEASLQTELIKTYSPAMVDRYQRVCQAVASVAPLHDDWQAMVDGSATAMRVVDDIDGHDSNATAALKLATLGRYPEALIQLTGATDALADATTIANTLAALNDVSTLTAWIGRTQSFDDALRLLWQTMISSKGKVTAQVTAALRGVNTAKALLPTNNDVLQVVLYETAGNLTSSGISIEKARGALSAALIDLTGGAGAGG